MHVRKYALFTVKRDDFEPDTLPTLPNFLRVKSHRPTATPGPASQQHFTVDVTTVSSGNVDRTTRCGHRSSLILVSFRTEDTSRLFADA
jgi:hypothetical protein